MRSGQWGEEQPQDKLGVFGAFSASEKLRTTGTWQLAAKHHHFTESQTKAAHIKEIVLWTMMQMSCHVSRVKE